MIKDGVTIIFLDEKDDKIGIGKKPFCPMCSPVRYCYRSLKGNYWVCDRCGEKIEPEITKDALGTIKTEALIAQPRKEKNNKHSDYPLGEGARWIDEDSPKSATHYPESDTYS